VPAPGGRGTAATAGCPLTAGHGCFGENEVVVLGGQSTNVNVAIGERPAMHHQGERLAR
jgi:hypothetical protein